ncbi:MAG: hypothetical protein ABJD97_16595 [Betaproteobacteria bacterium]
MLVAAGAVLVVLAFTSRRPDGFSIRRHAGGFGGSSTGWTISHSLAALLGAFALIVLAGMLWMARVPAKDDAGAMIAAASAPGREGAGEAGRAASGAASVASMAGASPASAPGSAAVRK